MENGQRKFDSIDDYIGGFPPETQAILKELREAIREAAPEAEEKISYQMPTFFLKGNLVYFAAYENHIGLYPAPSGIEAFGNELNAYKSGKGSIRFPIDEPLPLELIKRIVRFRVEENINKFMKKKNRK